MPAMAQVSPLYGPYGHQLYRHQLGYPNSLYNGYNGYSGYPGYNGYAGYPGNVNPAVYSGINGYPAYGGYPYNSGYTGSYGYPGISGYPYTSGLPTYNGFNANSQGLAGGITMPSIGSLNIGQMASNLGAASLG
jgi:hypothetical protein